MDDTINTMQPYCYRFDSKEQFWELARNAGLVVTTPDGIEMIATNSHTYCLDEIGTLFRPCTYDEDGFIIEPATPLYGWHVNSRGLAPSEWANYRVSVGQCMRQWLGGPADVS